MGNSADRLHQSTKLREVTFTLGPFSVEWVPTTLKTIASKHKDLQEILFENCACHTSLNLLIDATTRVGERLRREWIDIDRVLVQLWELHAVRVNVAYSGREEETARKFIGGLLPGTTERGIVGLVNLLK